MQNDKSREEIANEAETLLLEITDLENKQINLIKEFESSNARYTLGMLFISAGGMLIGIMAFLQENLDFTWVFVGGGLIAIGAFLFLPARSQRTAILEKQQKIEQEIKRKKARVEALKIRAG